MVTGAIFRNLSFIVLETLLEFPLIKYTPNSLHCQQLFQENFQREFKKQKQELGINPNS